jgi:hypothetical protein
MKKTPPNKPKPDKCEAEGCDKPPKCVLSVPTDYANEPESEVKQACLDAVLDLIGEWEWKRNSIPKNDKEMAELDSLAERLRNDLAPPTT